MTFLEGRFYEAVFAGAGLGGRALEQKGRDLVPSKKKEDLRRKTLIEATIRSIVDVGINETTVSTIIARAGLSRGMLHLYFKNKKELVIATAEHYSNGYYEKMQSFIDTAGDDPVDRLNAMIDADLSEEILNLETVVVWNALRSIAHTDEEIRAHTTTRDKTLYGLYRQVYEEILGPDEPDRGKAGEIAAGTIALTEGLWSDFFLYPDTFDRAGARRIVMRLIKGQVPV